MTAVAAKRTTKAAAKTAAPPAHDDAPKIEIKAIGPMVDKLWKLREDARALEAQIKTIEDKAKSMEEEIAEQLKAQGLDKATGKSASISQTSTIVADVQDWPAFHAYIAKNKFFHLLQKRVSDPAYRELLEAGKKVPGVQPFSRKKLNLRTLAS